jgi:hypothetical protein
MLCFILVSRVLVGGIADDIADDIADNITT